MIELPFLPLRVLCAGPHGHVDAISVIRAALTQKDMMQTGGLEWSFLSQFL